ncbi:MAG: ABC transporter permease [Anaerolineae bacterium]|jgi:simple sugar transport system permease protein|nr:ABC transporter permease [Anaerolineae bacterium]MBT4309661.1 ABC transporter permease [Anaerolineae bacterium]MBT4459445.1 ABC transporter permease [Anaerolineae bacterium]MBT4842045.1 ABC transporter permease [Anaerolineae bacterium]MBT6062684.1 ABC transporter permease [Anaerolineae bacterium]
MNLPYTVIFEKRTEDYPKWLPAVTSLASVIVAFIISGIVLKMIGGDPILVLKFFFSATFGSWAVFSDTMVKATPLIMVGLACAVAFKMKLWNIGAEGQFYMGAFFSSLVVLIPMVNLETTPKFIVIALMVIMGMIGGAIWGFIPGYLKAKYQVNEIIITLMLNYVALYWNNFWIFDKWSDAGFQMTPQFEKVAWLPRLSDLAKEYKAFSGITLHLGVVFGIIAAIIIWWILERSHWGYEIKLIGDNPQAARYAGLNITKNLVLVMMLSGALAGLAGMSEISGVVHRLQEKISPGYGFTGIIVAWLAKLNPFAVIIVSILFGALIIAGRQIQPSGIANLLQGIILFMVISSDVLLRYKIRIIRLEQEA